MHGHEDYGVSAKTNMIYQSLDGGEIAARLGSPVTYNRLGNVVFISDMTDGFSPWMIESDGADALQAVTSTPTFCGGMSLRICAPVDGTHTAKIKKYFWGLSDAVVGWQATISVDEFAKTAFGGLVDVVDGLRYIYKFTMSLQTKDVITLTTNDGDETLGNIGNVFATEHRFVDFKLVVDLNNKTYRRLYIGNQVFQLAKFKPEISSTTEIDSTMVYLGLRHDTFDAPCVYTDRCVVTVNDV